MIWVIAQAGEAVNLDWSLLENTPVWLPELVVNVLGTILCLVGFLAFVVGTIGEHMRKCFVVEVSLSTGKSILLQLYGNPETFLSAFRSVSNPPSNGVLTSMDTAVSEGPTPTGLDLGGRP